MDRKYCIIYRKYGEEPTWEEHYFIADAKRRLVEIELEEIQYGDDQCPFYEGVECLEFPDPDNPVFSRREIRKEAEKEYERILKEKEKEKREAEEYYENQEKKLYEKLKKKYG